MKKEDYSKHSTSDLYMKNGKPCGDIEATGTSGKGPTGNGSGPKVGGYPMGVHNKFGNDDPNAGMYGILAKPMASGNGTKVKDSVLDTKENKTWGGVIAPQNMAANNKIGV